MHRLELEFRELDYQHCFKWPFGVMGIYLFSNIVCTSLTWLVEETSDEKKGRVQSSKALGSERTLSQLSSPALWPPMGYGPFRVSHL